MAIDDNTIYGLYGSQIKDLPEKINAVKGKAKELTTADYNWPENDPDGIALWKLPKGMYYTGPNVKKYISTSRSVESSRTILIGAQNDTNSAIYLLADGNGSSYKFMERYIVNYTTGTEGAIYTYALTDKDIVDNLTSTDTTKALSANQGKALNTNIGDLTSLTTTAKTSVVAAINELGLALDGKQDELTAGQNITIAEESGALVISATGGSGADVFTTNEWNALWA